MSLEQQILTSWQINHNINMTLINSLSNDMMDFTLSKRGGGKIGHQLAHMYNVRYWKLENIKKELVKDLTTVKSGDEKTIELLTHLHEHSTNLIAQILSEGVGNDLKVKSFKTGIIPLLSYFIVHEAQHRGNILLVLKQKGIKLSDELKYGIWATWNKIGTECL